MNIEKEFKANRTIISKQTRGKTLYESERVSIDLMYVIECDGDKKSTKTKTLGVMHSHSMYEFHLVKSGETEFETEDGKKITIGKNNFVIIPPSLRHKITRESDNFRKILMSFEISSLEDDTDGFYNTALRLMKTPVLYKNSAKMTKLLNVIDDISKSESHDKYNMIFNLCVSYIMEICNVVVRKKDIRKNEVVSDKRVLAAIKFIKDNISMPISTSDVAKAVFMSTKQLGRVFKENMDMTPSKFIRMTKNEYVCKLLAETDLSLSDIAELVGIPDSAALIKRFKRIEGNTPKKYKHSIEKENKSK